MKRILQSILIGLAVIGVGALGYYSYNLATDTLRFALIGAQDQEGDALRLFVRRPSFLSYRTNDALWDVDALMASLKRNGLPWNPTVSSE